MIPIAIPDHLNLAPWTERSGNTALQEMLFRASLPGVISFALGMPAPELFPVEAVERACQRALSADWRALQYGPPSELLKDHILEIMRLRDVSCKREQVFLTAGAQQASSLLARLLLQPGCRVVTDEFTYIGFQQIAEQLQATLLGVPTEASRGMDLDALEFVLDRSPGVAAIYTMTNGHNPLGFSLDAEARARLAEIVSRRRIPMVEEDVYGLLSYEGGGQPPVRSLEANWVFYVGSLSKVIAPALRVGWLVVPESLAGHLANLKEATDINTATFGQRVAANLLSELSMPDHLERIRTEYTGRRNAMVDGVARTFPAGTVWRVPTDGAYIWVELPDGFDSDALAAKAIDEESVAVLGGRPFAVGSPKQAGRSMRLNFTHSSSTTIAEGMRRLSRVISRCGGR